MIQVGKNYSKADYEKVVDECLNMYEESWSDMDVIHPRNPFSCESAEEFGKFLINKGIFASKQQYDNACADYEKHYVTTMWNVLDLIDDTFGSVSSFDLLMEYADLNPAFAEASYQEGIEFLEDEENS